MLNIYVGVITIGGGRNGGKSLIGSIIFIWGVKFKEFGVLF